MWLVILRSQACVMFMFQKLCKNLVGNFGEKGT
jgi:hypothetical protein